MAKRVELRDADDALTTLSVGGSPFRCACGCNVFRRVQDKRDIYTCNACGQWYAGEKTGRADTEERDT